MLKKIILKIVKYKYRFIRGLCDPKCSYDKRCLLYYKTEPFYNKKIVEKYTHTNNWEIIEITKILNKFGFIVDVIDRDVDNFYPEDIYDLFIGLGAGNSGKHFSKYASILKKAVKLLYAAGPEPGLSNTLVMNRYDQFRERTGVKAPYQRIITEVNFKEFIAATDYIIVVGEQNNFSFNSYLQLAKPVLSIFPSSSPKLGFNSKWLKSRSMNSYLCFAGNGLICKGVDLLIEAFRRMPQCKLHICGPKEISLFIAYSNLPSNIIYEGFVKVGGKKYNKLNEECAYVILHSAAEGCATSVTTCLRSGLVPIVNVEVGVNAGDYGFLMTKTEPAEYVDDIVETINKTSLLEKSEYKQRVYSTLKYSERFTQGGFQQSFSNVILEVLEKENL
jgi:glycosyltransferase involved in cell wall biosynthesis